MPRRSHVLQRGVLPSQRFRRARQDQQPLPLETMENQRVEEDQGVEKHRSHPRVRLRGEIFNNVF